VKRKKVNAEVDPPHLHHRPQFHPQDRTRTEKGNERENIVIEIKIVKEIVVVIGRGETEVETAVEKGIAAADVTEADPAIATTIITNGGMLIAEMEIVIEKRTVEIVAEKVTVIEEEKEVTRIAKGRHDLNATEIGSPARIANGKKVERKVARKRARKATLLKILKLPKRMLSEQNLVWLPLDRNA